MLVSDITCKNNIEDTTLDLRLDTSFCDKLPAGSIGSSRQVLYTISRYYPIFDTVGRLYAI